MGLESLSRKAEKCECCVPAEVFYRPDITPQKPFNLSGRAVAQPHPDDFGGCAADKASLPKIDVFGDDHETVRFGVVSHRKVVRFLQPDVSDV